jgi:thiosulfate/3-mercaptopyruvate sulfurtransferase
MRCLGLAIAMLTSSLLLAEMLITPANLSASLNDPRLVILHIGSPKDYAEGHILGARLVTLADLSVTSETGLRLQLPPSEQLRTTLQNLGISDNSRVVLYAASDSVQSATRIWFTFDYLGLGRMAALLDGGLPAWREAGLPVATEVPAVQPGQLTVRPQTHRLADVEWLKQHLNDANVQLYDARLPEYYTGADAGQMPRAGRLPGARNVPYPSLLDEKRRFLPAAELKARLRPERQTLVSYCHIGLQATVIYFAARMLDLDVRLYDGSFQEWSRTADLPVDSGQ